MDESHKGESKKPDTKEYLLYNCICIQYKNGKTIQVLEVKMTVTLGRVVTGRGHQKGSWGSGAALFLDLGAGYTEYVPFCEN